MRAAAMSLPAAASGLVVLLLTVPVIQGQDPWGVTYSSTEICALKGSTVDMSCSYRYPSTVKTVEKKSWFTKESNGVYVDLRTDPEYSDRVQYYCGNNDCTLRITDLRESDSAEYKFRFTTQPDGRYYGSPGVTLRVTDLQVQVNTSKDNTYSYQAELKCHSSCLLPGRLHYVWYKNGRIIRGQTSDSYYSGYFTPTFSFSCAVEGHENSRSPPLLVKSLWDVTYSSTEICALEGSTVNIICTYRYPSTVKTVKNKFWFTRESNDVYTDLTTDLEYSGRVQYICGNNDCTLTITDLRESDSAEYKFRFITDQPGGKYYGSPGVTLSVTDPQLQVHVRRSTVNQYSTWTELTCHNNCQLSDHLSYIWYNNEQIVGRKKYFHPHPVNPEDRYHCAVSGYEHFSSGSVYGPQLPSVSGSPSAEIVEGSSVTLTCSSDANPAANYTWYKKNGDPDLHPLSKEPQLVFSSIQSSDSGEYYCTAENELGRRTSEYISITVTYGPKLPSVSVSPSAEIVEGSSVTLTCSSVANPAANYTWYKKNQTLIQGLEGVYHFSSIRSEHSGHYHCKSENKYGWINSSSLFIDVQYAPKLPSVSVSLSAEIVEGSLVNLTCSSDANPAANYTWYKENQTLIQGPEGVYHFSSISSEDRGIYYCKSENQYGEIDSSSLFIDVQYAPRLPSVSVSPSAEIVEGSSVTLTCSSDANPAANYTWYKENEDSPKASGQIFTITDFRAEHSGNYSCEAQNRRGRHNATLQLIVLPLLWKTAVIGTTPAVILAIIGLALFLLIRKKRAATQSPQPDPDNRTQEQDDLHYASVHFSKGQTDPVYSNIRPAGHQRHKEGEEEQEVEYAAVKFTSASAAPSRGPETGEDPSALYSTVNKQNR